jgi:two-component system, NarL family, nitrate/nitrite response regulator NarL
VALRCLIVDDNIHFLEAARHLLEQEGLDVVGAVKTSADAVDATGRLQPDVVLVDIDLGRESGLDLARELAAISAVILISTYAETDFADLIAASPARGFLPKSALSGDAIHDLMR